MIKNRGFEVYVGNLDPQVNEEMLYNFFGPCGVITSVKIMRHIVTRKSRGFGFVNFAKKDDAEFAQQKFDGKRIINNHIKVYLKDKFKSLDKTGNIVISNLPLDITAEELQALCRDFGPVFSVKILEGEDQASGLKRALVLFENLQAAQTCVEGMNGIAYRSNKLVVEASVKRDVVHVKGPYNVDIKDDLEKILAKFAPVEVGVIEKIEDNKTYMTTVKFQDEQAAKAFVQDFRQRKEDCELTRPHRARMRRRGLAQGVLQEDQGALGGPLLQGLAGQGEHAGGGGRL